MANGRGFTNTPGLGCHGPSLGDLVHRTDWKRPLLFVAMALSLAACSLLDQEKLTAAETTACEVTFGGWKPIDVDQLTFYQKQTALLGWRTGGAFFSDVYNNLETNADAAEALRTLVMSEKSGDPQMRTLVQQLADNWSSARDDGHMFIAIPTKTLNSAQMEYFTRASLSLIDAGTASTKIRGRCLELGYSEK